VPDELHSTAAINRHPLHPLLVTLPVGFLVGALLSDLGFLWTSDPFWARASAWLIGAGLVTGAIAAVAGFTDFFGNAAIRALKLVWWHWIGNAIALVVAIINLWLRMAGGLAAVSGLEVTLSVLTVVIFLFTGWVGGELVFKHGVAVVRGDRPMP